MIFSEPYAQNIVFHAYKNLIGNNTSRKFQNTVCNARKETSGIGVGIVFWSFQN